MYIKEIPDSYMSGILFGKVEVTFSIDQFLYHAILNLFTSNDTELVYQLILN